MSQTPETATAIATARIETPVGVLRLGASAAGLTHLKLEGMRPRCAAPGTGEGQAQQHLGHAAAALAEYFAGKRRDFDDLVLAPSGSPFQLRVWSALREIPFGATEGYGALAERIGEPGAARAVGLANNQNPIGIIVPCHRVIGADGSLVGYAGGLELKEWLLGHEGALSLPMFAPRPSATR